MRDVEIVVRKPALDAGKPLHGHPCISFRSAVRLSEGGESNGGVLRKVQVEEADEESHGDHNEEQEAGDHRDLPDLRHEDVQDRQVSCLVSDQVYSGGSNRIQVAAPVLSSGGIR